MELTSLQAGARDLGEDCNDDVNLNQIDNVSSQKTGSQTSMKQKAVELAKEKKRRNASVAFKRSEASQHE